jgi:signal transduction histidine kinase
MHRDGDHAEITVTDDGIGIDSSDIPQLFDMYFRVRQAATHQPGVGLSLPLVRALVDLHGGTVSASSDGRGKGSVFTVRLPIVSPERLRTMAIVH